MVFITGDTHCPIDIGKLRSKKLDYLTKEDYLIVCGDFGVVWHPPEHPKFKDDVHWLKWFDNRPFTTLFVDGNHEGFPTLNSYPIVDFCGGKAGKISKSIYHLKRGEVYTICGKTIFCFGGARSHDKATRLEGVSWWPEELPSLQEMTYGIDTLLHYYNTVDFIISHCCSSKIQSLISAYYETDSLTQYFNFLETEVNYKHWFFGHYHIDSDLDNRHTCLYDKILRII